MPPRLIAAGRRLRSADVLIVLGLFLFALFIRIVGIRGWLPYVGHPDEPKVIDSAIHIVKSGDLNPNLYIWPSLYIYLEAIVVRLHTWWGTLRGYYDGAGSLPDITHIFSLAPGVYMWARTLTAVIGAATISVLYVVGKQMFDGNRRIGVAAALLVAVSPLHVEYSHFGITDVPLGMAGLLVLWASFRLASTRYAGEPYTGRYDPLFWRAALAGLLVGVAAGTKYNGLYVGVVPLIALGLVWWRWRRSRTAEGERRRFITRRLLAALAAIPLFAALAFLLCEPYIILDWTSWYNGFTFQVRAYEPADSWREFWEAIAAHVYDLSTSDWHLVAAGALGSLAMLLSPIARGRAWLLIPFPILYTLAMSRFSLTYVRNMIITMPYLALLGAFAIDLVAMQVANLVRSSGAASLFPRLEDIHVSRRVWGAVRWALVVLAVALIAWNPLRISWAYSQHMEGPDSRTLAWNWMRDRMAEGERFAAELHPWQVQSRPDVFPFDVEVPANKQELTARPPSWYAERGYDYVVLNSNFFEQDRDREDWPLYQALPEAAHFAGDKEGGKGPTISVRALDSNGPPIMSPAQAQVEDFAVFEGHDLAPLTSTAVLLDPAGPPPPGDYVRGGAVGLNLYYRALRDGSPYEPGWQVWVHLVDPATGATVAQVDVPPLTGLYRGYPEVRQIARPVSQWYRGEWVTGTYNLAIPEGLAPGTYRLETGMWVPPSGPSAKYTPSGGQQAERVALGEIEVR
ncbi:MAG TPA: glycosyltransferase family 39 protein [Chloroflexia bacterium]|nr:glycosyltransferase family 39 protein [Chloroflexia bacterium]